VVRAEARGFGAKDIPKSMAPTGDDVADLPVFDLSAILESKPGSEGESLLKACKDMAKCLHDTSCLVVRDPRVSEGDNIKFMEMVKRYYAQDDEAKKADARPEIHYQVGVTPAGVEKAICASDPKCIAEMDSMPEEHRPLKPKTADPKWRFFWRVGPRPEESDTKFPDLNAAPVVPEAFKGEWADTCDGWGNKTLGALHAVAEMLGLGFDLGRSTFKDMMHNGPHLLAPTGSELSKHRKFDPSFAGYHNDLNFLTVHGKSNFPGLRIWLRDGTRKTVTVPDGCLLLQAGQQFEYVTGGHVKAGFHEVICSEKTASALESREQNAGGKLASKDYWRISTTMFGTLCHDTLLQPIGRFADLPEAKNYPPMLGGDQVAKVLMEIGMANAASAEPLTMRLSHTKSVGFYTRAAATFLKGAEGKDPVDKLRVAALGNSVGAAVSVASRMEADGLGKITKIETSYPDMKDRQCAHIYIDLERI
jgi:isopenicillin N synthase-like dioxygenase